jgi:hypothetical protein
MRKLFAIAPVVALSIAFAGPTAGFADTSSSSPIVMSNDPAAAGLPSLDPNSGADVYGVGGGTTHTPFMQHFDMSAHTGPQGDFGTIGVTETDPTGATVLSYKVDVSCLHVHGTVPGGPLNRGVIKGQVSNVSPTVNPFGVTQGATLIFGIKDGDAGMPQSTSPVDDFFAPNTDVFPGLSCKFIFYVGNFNNVVTGNVVIKAG